LSQAASLVMLESQLYGAMILHLDRGQPG
jgi:hypothetical protein